MDREGCCVKRRSVNAENIPRGLQRVDTVKKHKLRKISYFRHSMRGKANIDGGSVGR